MYLKIINLMNVHGQCDYKSLDILKIVSGSAFYSADNTTCVLEYNDEFSPHDEVIEISNEEYESYRPKIKNTISLDERISEVEKILNDMLLGGI